MEKLHPISADLDKITSRSGVRVPLRISQKTPYYSVHRARLDEFAMCSNSNFGVR